MALVLDASVAVAWCLPDESSDSATMILDLVRQSYALVPAIWPVELAHALRNAQLRGRANQADFSTFFELLDGLVIRIVPSCQSDAATLLKFAADVNLSVYDASYLRVAMESKLPIATFDKAILQTAKVRGVPSAISNRAN